MSLGLFDKIHDIDLDPGRAMPVTQRDFIEFGLNPGDYSQYIGLQSAIQGLLLLDNDASLPLATLDNYIHNLENKLLSFCKVKHLISDNILNCEGLFRRSDAEYYYGWLRYPKDNSEFRLNIEHKLSMYWDEEAAYITEKFGCITFIEDNSFQLPENGDIPLLIQKCIPNSDTFTTRILNSVEISQLLIISQKDKQEAEQSLKLHEKQMPREKSALAHEKGPSWIKKLYKLSNYNDMVQEKNEMIERALATAMFCEAQQKPIYLNSDFSSFGETSIFHDMGYTVSQSEGLSDRERQAILEEIIKNGYATQYATLQFLRQRMNINGMKIGNELAYHKWHEDYKFVKNLDQTAK